MASILILSCFLFSWDPGLFVLLITPRTLLPPARISLIHMVSCCPWCPDQPLALAPRDSQRKSPEFCASPSSEITRRAFWPQRVWLWQRSRTVPHSPGTITLGTSQGRWMLILESWPGPQHEITYFKRGSRPWATFIRKVLENKSHDSCSC